MHGHHHPVWAAVAAPAAGGAALELAGLLTFLTFIVLIGLHEGWNHTLGLFFRWLANEFRKVSIPTGFFGSVHPLDGIADGLEAIDRTVANALATAALNCEHAASWCFHWGGIILLDMAREIADVATELYRFGLRFETHTLPRILRDVFHHARIVANQAADEVRRELHHVEAHVLHEVNGVRKWLAHRLTVVEGEIAHALPRIGSLERDFSNLWKRLKQLEDLLTGGAILTLVIAALGSLGLGWLRCPSLKGLNDRHGCSTWSSLEGLLGLVATVLLIEDLEKLAHDGVRIEGDVVKGVAYLVGLSGWLGNLEAHKPPPSNTGN